MDATAQLAPEPTPEQPASEPATEPPRQPGSAPLPPRMERFCRVVADGESLAEAARRAGYAPASARQRGSELWARDDVQARICELREHEEDERRARIEGMRRRYEKLVDRLDEEGQTAASGRLLGQWWRFEKDAEATRRLSERERERLREEMRRELRWEVRLDLKVELHQEVYAELRRELRDEALRAEIRVAEEKAAEERIDARREAAAAAAVTNHDEPPRSDVLPKAPPPPAPLPHAVLAERLRKIRLADFCVTVPVPPYDPLPPFD